MGLQRCIFGSFAIFCFNHLAPLDNLHCVFIVDFILLFFTIKRLFVPILTDKSYPWLLCRRYFIQYYHVYFLYFINFRFNSKCDIFSYTCRKLCSQNCQLGPLRNVAGKIIKGIIFAGEIIANFPKTSNISPCNKYPY